MNELEVQLSNLNDSIRDLKVRMETARIEAEKNIKPLREELDRTRREKSRHAQKNDVDSVQQCIRREGNLNFRIDAEWNEYFILKGELSDLNHQRMDLESKIRLEKDRQKRANHIKSQMDLVLKNYEKSQNLTQAAIDSNISPEWVNQWYEWGEKGYSETYVYFHERITQIDNQFKNLEAQKTRREMDRVIDAYRKTGSLKKAAETSNVSSDKVEYWYKWGSMGFGDENRYFFENLDK